MLSAAWEVYNSNDSWLPLAVPLVIWAGCFLSCYLPSYSKKRRPIFHKWQSVHNFHNCGAVFLAVLSIYFNDDHVLNERVVTFWSLSYFGVDLVDCLLRRDVEYIVHATFCILLGVTQYASPVSRALRMNSKGLLCELSTPFMHLSKRTRDPIHFVLFALVFTLCRILWVPFLTYHSMQFGLRWYDYQVIFFAGFWMLNAYWYVKILKILKKHRRRSSISKQ